jgi:ferritin-like metal-binding protein YciE
MAKLKNLHDFFLHELGDTLDAEQQITKALPKVIEVTTDPTIKRRLEQHLEETQAHIQNLEACFKSLGEPTKAEKCPGMAGILQEADKLIKENPPVPVLEVGNLAGSAKVEHYEIEAYTSLIGLAKVMGHTECERLLMQNLKQEQDMARFIEHHMPLVVEKMAVTSGDKDMAKQPARR